MTSSAMPRVEPQPLVHLAHVDPEIQRAETAVALDHRLEPDEVRRLEAEAVRPRPRRGRRPGPRPSG